MVVSLLGASLIIFLYNLSFYSKEPGLGFGLLVAAVNIFFFTTSTKSKNLIPAFVFSSLATLHGLFLGFRANEFVYPLNFLASLFFTSVAAYLYKLQAPFSLYIPEFLVIPALTIFKTIQSAISQDKKESRLSGKSDLIISLIKGFGISIPVFFILAFLLSQADPIFEKLISDVLENIWGRVIVSTFLFTSLFFTGLSVFKPTAKITEVLSIGKTKHYELSIILVTIVTLFTAFISVQIRYLFFSLSERDLGQIGVESLTFSEYVRKGFFELLVASAISGIAIIYILRYLNHIKNNSKKYLQIATSLLTIETGILLFSAFKRLLLYGAEHGLTRARIIGFIFLIWLSVILVILLIRVFKNLNNKILFYLSTSVTIIMLFALNLVNIDGLLVDKFKPTVNNEIDYYYLTGISADAYKSWYPAYDDSKKIFDSLKQKRIDSKDDLSSFSHEDLRKLYWSKFTIEQLNSQIQNLDDKYSGIEYVKAKYKDERDFDNKPYKNSIPPWVDYRRSWVSFNLGEYQAFQEINKNDFKNQVKILFDDLSNLYQKIEPKLWESVPLDRDTSPPLTN